ncbi:1,4-alpha-glucan-branching enzyme [Trema orientale]|uniref:1,4-alpha-glucan-branching enzyme n=1 Tax=Trema orientale TaxID=63057 RepID=A0A2P5B6T0_TREOI|nr:1,4-alpha-glucan-branching enzyme [Trema orientale]
MAGSNGIKGGYWLSKQANIFPPERIPTSYFSHLFYAFVGVNATNGKLIISKSQEIKNFMTKVHGGHKKAILSIGGPRSTTENPSTAISVVASDPTKRAAFINSTIDEAQRYGFDGLDLAWEFPETQVDMDHMATLFEEWRSRVDDRQAELLLTASVYFASEIPRGSQSITYPADSINLNLDFVNLILYDYTPTTGAHAQFHANQAYTGSGDRGITSWSNAGVPANKLVMGIPFFGKKWTLLDENDNGIGAPVVSYDGVVPYNQIPGASNGTYDSSTISQYLAYETSWYGYDGKHSITEKIHTAKRGNLVGGYFVYALGDEDSQGHTLSKAASDAWDN